MKIKCAVIDDEPLARGLLENYVRKTNFLELHASYASAVEAVGGLHDSPADLLLLDIQMPELNGLEFSKLVSKDTRIIFTTAFDQYALDGYKVNALDYLLKPISYADFLAAARKAQEWFSMAQAADGGTGATAPVRLEDASHEDSLFVKSDYKLIRVRFEDILYVEGLKDYVKIYLASTPKPLLSLCSMHSLESRLPQTGFLRIHRSFIVNMERVSVLERGQIVFGEKRIPVSDSYKENVQEYINRRMLWGRT